MKEIFLTFIPLFVAVDALGVLPIFVSLTEGLKKKERQKMLGRSIVTSFSVAIVFILLGQAIFHFLGITIGDFMIAGGILLFCIAVSSILQDKSSRHSQDVAIVPLATPLIVGPAVLTTSLLLVSQYGTMITLMALIVNLLLAGVIFSSSDVLLRIFGKDGSRALSKITSLLLAAIAVMMIRKGLMQVGLKW
jgi:multiple antibiotic resistance protein